MQRTTARYDVALMERDAVALGLLPTDVARLCKPAVAASTVTRFLNGSSQTPRIGARIAKALGHSLERYLKPKPVARRKRAARLNHAGSVAR
jgi:hypothetical protein